MSKTNDLNTELTPCFDGPNYSDAEFEKLGKELKEKFHCTSPFLPKIFRAGAKLCKNDTVGREVQNFIRATGMFATNMWKNDYFFLPPCTYNTYSYQQTNVWSGLVEVSVKSKKILSFMFLLLSGLKSIDTFLVMEKRHQAVQLL